MSPPPNSVHSSNGSAAGGRPAGSLSCASQFHIGGIRSHNVVTMRQGSLLLPFLCLSLLAGCSMSHAPATIRNPEAALRARATTPPVRAERVRAPALTTQPLVAGSESAVAMLERRVVRMSHPEALRTAFRAYRNYRETHPDEVRKPYLYFVDYGLDSREPRGWVFDMDRMEVVEGPFMVAHGRGSANGPYGVPMRFTNIENSLTTSLGLYLAEETYRFRGTASGRGYSSVGLRLRGVSGQFNNAARTRGIVVHGAPYVTPAAAGRSEGCPAMEPARAERLIPMIADGGMVFHYSPYDTRWLTSDPWLSTRPGRLASVSE